jgi:hypothetical protein
MTATSGLAGTPASVSRETHHGFDDSSRAPYGFAASVFGIIVDY